MKNENILIIEPGQTEKNYWTDLWRYRELFYILSWRDITVRYKQTAIGIAWAILRPLLTMVVFTVIFGKLAKLPGDEPAPYPIMVYATMLPWQFFSSSVSEASNSLITNTQLITKVYFPRIIIPISSVVTSLVDFLVSFAILIFLMMFYKFTPSWNILLLPVFILISFLTASGIGLYFMAFNVNFSVFCCFFF